LEDEQDNLTGLDAFLFKPALGAHSAGKQVPHGDGLVFFAGVLQVDRNLVRPIFIVGFEDMLEGLH
jgi:hypothetical protein